MNNSNSGVIIQLDRPDSDMIVEIMVGEYMELTTKTIARMSKPWSALTEDVQKSMLNSLQQQAIEAIAKMVRLTASIDHDVLQANLVDAKVGKKEITAKIELSLTDPKREEFFRYANRQVMIVLADPEDYIVDGEIPEADPDQPSLNRFG